VVYTPKSVISCERASWQPKSEQEPFNRIRFFSKWTGCLWQDDETYLSQDALSHDILSALYRDLGCRVAAGVQRAIESAEAGSKASGEFDISVTPAPQ
jgi:hypothetical protein